MDRAIDFLIGRKHSRKDRQVKVSFRELKAHINWPTTDQKVRGSNPCGRTNSSGLILLIINPFIWFLTIKYVMASYAVSQTKITTGDNNKLDVRYYLILFSIFVTPLN
jgi:hypothetical protein